MYTAVCSVSDHKLLSSSSVEVYTAVCSVSDQKLLSPSSVAAVYPAACSVLYTACVVYTPATLQGTAGTLQFGLGYLISGKCRQFWLTPNIHVHDFLNITVPSTLETLVSDVYKLHVHTFHPPISKQLSGLNT